MRIAITFLSLIIGIIGGLVGAGIYDYAQERGIVPSFIKNALPDQVSETVGNIERRIVEESDTSTVAQNAIPSVVSIVATQEVSTATSSPFQFSPFFDPFFTQPTPNDGEGKTQQVEVSSGTGFVISEDGLIATNRHVVNNEEATYTVYFQDGTSYEGTLLAADDFTDFAIIKIDAKDLKPLLLGNSDSLQLGQSVIAIGNTLGEYDNTVTRGVVSGLSRNLGGEYSGLVQTDAAINRGNSGGPLLNLSGEVVGINTAVDRAGEGIGFAIPINEATTAIESVKKEGRIIRPALGVRYVPLNEEIAKINNLAYDYGAYIRGTETEFGVVEGSAADKAGLKEGDIILEVDGVKITEETTLPSLIKKHKIGDAVKLKVFTDGEEKEMQVVLEELPQQKEE